LIIREGARVIGGGAKGRLLRQIMADVYGRKILCLLLIEEATSLGAAIAGGIGTGIFKNAYKALVPIYEQIASLK